MFQKTFRLIVPALIISEFLTACVATPRSVAPLSVNSRDYKADKIESSLIDLSNRAHQDFIKQGLLVNDPELNNYLDRIGRQFMPPLPDQAEIHFYVIKDASINAMAFPNGNIYVNIGLITKLQSEDQLALVLAHETVHFVQRHSYKGQLDRQNSTVAAHVTDLLLFGTGLAYIPYALDIVSFSRDQEKEADIRGLEYLGNTDYNLENSIEIFGLLGETKHRDSGSAWDNHPDLVSRKEYSRQKIAELIKPQNQQPPLVQSYERIRIHVADLNIQTRLLRQQYELARDAIDEEIRRQGDHAKWHAYRGDALRGSAEHPEAAARENAWLYKNPPNEKLTQSFQNQSKENFLKADAEYQIALKMDKNFPSSYRGLGMIALQQDHKESAKNYLHQYLELEPTAKDRRYIEGIINKLAQ